MDNIIPSAYKCNKAYKLHMPIGYMRPSMLIDDLIIGRDVLPVFERPDVLAHYRQYCNFTRRACSASVGSKPQAAGHKPPTAGVQRDIIAIMPRHSRKAGQSRGRSPRFQWARVRFFAVFGLAGLPVIKINVKPPSLRFVFTLVFPHVPNKNQNKRPSSSK